MTTLLIDTSHHQPGFARSGANADGMLSAENAGARAVIARCSFGDGLTDREFLRSRSRAEELRLPFAAYAFLTEDTAAAQVRRILSALTDLSTPVWLDLEPYDEGGSRPRLPLARAVREGLENGGADVAGLYLPEWYWEQIGRPDLQGWPNLWASSYPSSRIDSLVGLYPGDGSSRWDPYGGVQPVLWQYASTVRVPGYTENTVDGNAFRGSPRALKRALPWRMPWLSDKDAPNARAVLDAARKGVAANKDAPSRRERFEEIVRIAEGLL